MLSESLLSFIIASTLISFAPGPDNVFVLTQSALYGKRAGLLVTLGLCTGLVFHTMAVAFGVAALFQAFPMAFDALKLIGAAYLLYLAWQSFKVAPSDLSSASQDALSGKGLYMRGIVMSITNPKLSIFFLAFLPQFVTSYGNNLVVQFIFLGLIFMLVGLAVFSLITVMAGALGQILSRSVKYQVYLHRIAGAVFITLALTLLTTGVGI